MTDNPSPWKITLLYFISLKMNVSFSQVICTLIDQDFMNREISFIISSGLWQVLMI